MPPTDATTREDAASTVAQLTRTLKIKTTRPCVPRRTPSAIRARRPAHVFAYGARTRDNYTARLLRSAGRRRTHEKGKKIKKGHEHVRRFLSAPETTTLDVKCFETAKRRVLRKTSDAYVPRSAVIDCYARWQRAGFLRWPHDGRQTTNVPTVPSVVVRRPVDRLKRKSSLVTASVAMSSTFRYTVRTSI